MEQVLAVVQEGRHDPAGLVLPWASLSAIRTLIPVESLVVVTMDPKRLVPLTVQELSDDGMLEETPASADDGEDSPFARHFASFAIPMYQERTGDLTTPLRWSDFYSDRDLLNQPLWVECFRPDDFYRGMILTLPAPFPAERRLLFWRGQGRDFTDQDVAILSLLRPHLYELMREVERRQAPGTRLSPRETEVLRLVGLGRSNKQIADTLVVSIATVRKHLENVYVRTGTHNRLAAAELVRTDQPVRGLVQSRSGRSPRRAFSAPL